MRFACLHNVCIVGNARLYSKLTVSLAGMIVSPTTLRWDLRRRRVSELREQRMARQQRFDWFMSQQRKRLRRGRATDRQQSRKLRKPGIEPLEPRTLLSVNCGLLPSVDTASHDESAISTASFNVAASTNAVAHDHNGDGIADHAPQDHDPGCGCESCLGVQASSPTLDDSGSGGVNDHDPGCCCESCLGIQVSIDTHIHYHGDGHSHHDHSHIDGYWYIPPGEEMPDIFGHQHGDHDPGCCCDQCLAASGSGSGFEEFNTVGAVWEDQDLNKEGHQITYSYSNFFDGGILGGLTEEDLRAATEEALNLWAAVTPLNFIEVVDSGPLPDPDGADDDYEAENHPNIRIGHHFIDGATGSNVLAHAYFPPPVGGMGQAGDVHFDNANVWGLGTSSGNVDIIETMTHEIGHSLGLGHEFVDDAIMNPFIGGRYANLGDGFLLPDDIAGIQSLYGEGVGSVEPLTPFEVNTLDDGDDTALMLNPGTMQDELVDTTPDFLTLREALKLANFRGDGREVTFDEELFTDLTQSYTITLDESLGPLQITAGVGIQGPGLELVQNPDLLTIVAPDSSATDGDGMTIFEINNEDPLGEIPDTVANVFISGLSLTGGDSATAGGAINTTENLSLTNVHIYDNYSGETGGAIYSTQLLSIVTSTVDSNRAANDGGAVHTTGGTHVDSSTFNNNQSGDEGGAIAAEGQGTDVIVTSSTLSGNTAAGNGGAIHNIDDNPTKFRILHSTVYQNNSGGSGGGIYMLDGVLALEHSIVAGNTSAFGAADLDNINPFDFPAVLARYSLVQDPTGSQITSQAPNIFLADPLLGPLMDNGGLTQTHEPMSSSPVLNAGNPSIPVVPDNDQRGVGFTRIFEGVIDIGSVESGGFAQTFTVNSLLDKSDLNEFGVDQSPQDTTLREAIGMANLSLGKNLINFEAALNGGTIELSMSLGELLISDIITIDATDLAAGLTISAATTDPTPTVKDGNGTRVLRIDDGDATTFDDVELLGLTFIGGDVTGHGGAIHSLENLLLNQVSVLDSYAIGNGGGVYHKAGADGGTLVIENSTIARNEATADGGGLWSDTNLPADPDPDPDPNPIVGVIVNSTVSNNFAGDEGGGIMNFDGQLEIRHSTITENEAAHGSGVVSFGDALTKTLVYSSIIAGNVIDLNDPLDLADDTGFDVQRSRNVAFNSFESLGYNLIGFGSGLSNFNNNDQIEVADPMLGSLANNGGKTQTHALLPGSPAIDSSDPDTVLPLVNATEDDTIVTEFDQRGDPFTRIADGDNDGALRLDIGAFELPVPEPDADFDNDGDTDGTDFLTWQRGKTIQNPQRSDGDADADGDVDADDLTIWTDKYGEFGPSEHAVPTAETPAMRPSSQPVRRSGYRVTSASSHTQVDVLAAAAHDFFTREPATASDQVESHAAAEAITLAQSSAPALTAQDSPATRRADTLAVGGLIGESQSETESTDSLDRAFESIGEEQPLRL